MKKKYDPGFGKSITWDIPLLVGYEYEFMKNTAKDPGSHHRNGIINPDLIAKIKSFDPDTILVYGHAYKSHLQVMRYFKGKIPLWFRGDSTLLDDRNGIKKIVKQLYLKWVYSHIDKAFYVGNQNKAYFLKYGLKEKQLLFAPHAIDNIRFSENRAEEALKLRENLKIKHDAMLILFAGKFEPKKDPEILLTALAELNLPNVHLLFVGNGELEAKLKDTSLAKNMTDKVHFFDFQNQSQMPVVYQACDLFCLPSKGPGETWGLAINEAMASGRPVITSDKVGCASDLVKMRINGEIFKSGDVSDFRRKLKFLLSNPELLRNMGEQSREIIKNWNFFTQATIIMNTLDNINEKH